MVLIRHRETRDEREVAEEAVPFFPGYERVEVEPEPVQRKKKAGQAGHTEEAADG